MKRPDWQLSRNGLFWVLLAFASVVALHFDHLPAWVTGLAVLCIVWRGLEYRGMLPLPPWPLKVILVGACLFGLSAEYRSLLGLEPMLRNRFTRLGAKELAELLLH